MGTAGTASGRIGRWWHRAREVPGSERQTVLLIVKRTLAATLAWLVSFYLLDAPSPAFAPFSAVLIMQVTVYQSLLQSLRYLAAVAVGVVMVAVIGSMVGSDLLSFVVVTVIALAIGRWPKLGSQGSQVATASFFAFSVYSLAPSAHEKTAQLAEIVLLVVIGCGIGVAVNLTVAPPMRYRSAEYALRTLSTALGGLVSDIYPVLREDKADEEHTSEWRSRAENTGRLIAQARDGFRTAQESLYYNPRLLLRRSPGRRPSFEGYGAVLEALVRSLYQVGSLTRSLDQWRRDDGGHDDAAFFRSYADFLESVSRIAEVLGELDEDVLEDQTRQIGRLTREAQECCSAVAGQAGRSRLPLTDPTHPYGVLVVESTRLMEELQHTSDVLGAIC
ncbi:hypothetical protein E6R60_14270 [Streptomyces sp. A0642]|uniref:FUSC family protein n=1 Tax=Streptomyces sp. A0642 TaxID=2563100 RepID=UPI0010A22919|nr:aromatic acid exporter family protein [Streptomyces sp. A0642]THA76127.1 hypothetical protein E6R60_14270 [Streptomyces sp. A0642]